LGGKFVRQGCAECASQHQTCVRTAEHCNVTFTLESAFRYILLTPLIFGPSVNEQHGKYIFGGSIFVVLGLANFPLHIPLHTLLSTKIQFKNLIVHQQIDDDYRC
jgi:hypothetical protein